MRTGFLRWERRKWNTDETDETDYHGFLRDADTRRLDGFSQRGESPCGDIWVEDADTRGLDGVSQMNFPEIRKGATIVSIVLSLMPA